MGRRHSARHYGRIIHGRKPAVTPPFTRATPSKVESTDATVAGKQIRLLELPRDILQDIMIKLPFGGALSFGSTCHILHQCLRTLRPALIQLLLRSTELRPKVELGSVFDMDPWTTSMFPFFACWNACASQMLFRLAVQEQIEPSTLWASVLPHIPLTGLMQQCVSIRCSFQCTAWVAGSLRKHGEELHLFNQLAQSDLKRIDNQFTAVKDCFVADGVLENNVTVMLCRDVPHIEKQHEAALLLHWVKGTLRTVNGGQLRHNSVMV